MKEKIREIFFKLEADVCGIADIERFKEAPYGFNPSDIYKECRSIIAFGKALPIGLKSVEPELVYNHFKEISMKELDLISYKAALAIEKFGGRAVPIPSNTPYEYWDDENYEGKGLVSVKHAAVLCGLGSLGKNTLFINEKFGNMLNLGVVLTNLDLKSDELTEDLCIEECRLCVESCPGGAISEMGIVQKKCREFSIGKNAKGFDICKCNNCRIVCPKNRV